MRKMTLAGAFLLCTFPLFASAQTAQDLKNQVQGLLDQLKYIQGMSQQGTQGGYVNTTGQSLSGYTQPAVYVNSGATGGTNQGVQGIANGAGLSAVDSSTCPQVGRALKRGMTGDDVKRLQVFLGRDTAIYPDGTASGFYGALTEAAVKRWQAKFNIVSSGTPDTTGWGVVGPRTAAAISLQCTIYGGGGGGTGAAVGGFMQVTPISGNAPLSVNVQATVNTTNVCGGATYTLDWGDGTPRTMIQVPANQCTQMMQTYSHTYQYGGTWHITLSAGGHQTDATVVVYGGAGGQTQLPVEAAYGPLNVVPAVGGDPLAVTASFPLGATCPAYTLAWGDGSAGISQGSGCPQGATPSMNHSYPSTGTYLITLTRGSQTDTASVIITQ